MTEVSQSINLPLLSLHPCLKFSVTPDPTKEPLIFETVFLWILDSCLSSLALPLLISLSRDMQKFSSWSLFKNIVFFEFPTHYLSSSYVLVTFTLMLLSLSSLIKAVFLLRSTSMSSCPAPICLHSSSSSGLPYFY